jgi:hypothetical protein
MYSTIGNYLNLYKPSSSVEKKTIENTRKTGVENYNSNEAPFDKEVDIKNNSTSYVDPKIFGPIFWSQLHISASHYPITASPIVRERMKNRILAIPVELPCVKCSIHATQFIESHKDKLDQIVSGRHELGKFYTDFHNHVNKRYGKPEWSYEDVYKKYSGTKVNFV